MKNPITTNILLAVLVSTTTTSAFVITDCTNGKSTNFGDNKCQIWTASSFRYQSDAKCRLTAFKEGNCAGAAFGTNQQNVCQNFAGVTSVLCTK